MLRLTSKRLLGLGFRGTQSPAAAAASQLLLPRLYHERVADPTSNPRNAGSFGRKTSPPSSSVATEWVKGKQMEEVPTIKNRSHKPANSSEILNYMGGLDGEENQLIKKLVNFRMKEGKRTRVRSTVYKTIHHLARTERDVIKLVADALENVKPICEVEKVGIAGTLYDVPGIVTKDRQQTLAVRWVLDAAFKRRTSHRITLEKCLSAEILDAHRKRGVARKKRESLHGLASTNRSFAHFRWW